jgi:DNA phosphorothioation-associated DGQHR protein 1
MSNDNNNLFLSRPALKVDQKFGLFYVCVLKASELLELTFSDSYRYEDGRLTGSQRELNQIRLKEIKEYIKGVDCAFPNSIILAANIDQNGLLCRDDDSSWKINENSTLEIPKRKPLAAVVDGQHRINGFQKLKEEELLEENDMELVCSIYLELPTSMQAYLFATINSTQRSVKKTLYLDLFGYEIASTPPNSWSPDKIAISLTRKLNEDKDSPLYRRVDSTLFQKAKSPSYTLSSLVDSILRLISSNPKDDKYKLHRSPIEERVRISLRKFGRKDSSPLRDLYINSRDEVIYKIIINYLQAADNTLHFTDEKDSILSKNVGIQGLFDSLKSYINAKLKSGSTLQEIEMTTKGFEGFLKHSAKVNFEDDFYNNSTGIGRQHLRATINIAYDPTLELRISDDLKQEILKHITPAI